MLRVTKLTDYATVILVALAEAPGRGEASTCPCSAPLSARPV